MAKRIFITGSTTGLGVLAAKELIKRGHEVVVHARNEARAQDILQELPEVKGVVIGDLANLEQTKQLANEINNYGVFDTIIHNAGIASGNTKDMLHVNVLAPYILTCFVDRPKQLIYLSSNMHTSGTPRFAELFKTNPQISYSDSKLLITIFAIALSRLWQDTKVNAVDPGWVPTRMSSYNAPDSLEEGYMTQVILTEEETMTGQYLYHRQPDKTHHPLIYDRNTQNKLLEALASATGITLPE